MWPCTSFAHKRMPEPYPKRPAPRQQFASKVHPLTILKSTLTNRSKDVDSRRLALMQFFSQPFYLQHLKVPPRTVVNKQLTTPLESALTNFSCVTPSQTTLTKNRWTGPHQQLNAKYQEQFFSQARMLKTDHYK